MVVDISSIKGLWPILSRAPWLVALVLRKYFTPTRLAGLVYVDLYPRHESARVDLGQVAGFQIHLHVINLSPVELELEQANFNFYCGGVRLESILVKKQRIAPGADTSLFLSGPISDGQANQIARLYRQNESSLDGNIEFKCAVRSFARAINRLDGIRLAVVNESQRLSSV